jgi:hypothetical protein
VSEPTGPPRACHDCGTVLTGRWCSACGQEDQPLDVTLRDVLGDAFEALTNLEGRAFRSLGRLLLAPGYLTREYIEGRRTRWVSPVRLYLVVSVVYFGLTSMTGWGALDVDVNVTEAPSQEAQEQLEALGFTTEAELDAVAVEAIGTWLPRAMFLLVPIFAGLVAIACRRAGKTYPQHLVFSMHVHAAAFGVFALGALVTGPIGSEGFEGLVQGASFVYALVYFVFALRTAYGGSLIRNAVLGVLVGIAYSVLVLAVTIVILMPLMRPAIS